MPHPAHRAWRAAPSLLLPASSWQHISPCCSFGVVLFIFVTLGRSDAFVASSTRVCPSARLAVHKPALSLWANWLYLLSLLYCARVYLLLLLLYLFVRGRLFVFLFAFLSGASAIVPLSMSTGLGGDFGHCPSLGCGQGRLWAAWFSRVPRGATCFYREPLGMLEGARHHGAVLWGFASRAAGGLWSCWSSAAQTAA